MAVTAALKESLADRLERAFRRWVLREGERLGPLLVVGSWQQLAVDSLFCFQAREVARWNRWNLWKLRALQGSDDKPCCLRTCLEAEQA